MDLITFLTIAGVGIAAASFGYQVWKDRRKGGTGQSQPK